MKILASALLLVFAQVQCDFTPFLPGGSSGQDPGGQTSGGINGGEPAGSPIPEIGEPVSVQVISQSSVDATVHIRFLVQDYTVRETNLHVPAKVVAQLIGPDVAAFVRIEGEYTGGGATPSMVQILGQDFQGGDTIEYIIPDPFDDCPDDPDKNAPGICGCGVPDIDTDGDGTMDCVDLCPADANKVDPGLCGCGVAEDTGDRDGDGVINCLDGCPDDASKTEPGQCGCGVPDTDLDGDGVPGCLDDNDQPVVGGGGGGGGEPPLPTCAPLPDGSGCQSVSCSDSGESCVPVKIRVNHETHQVTVLACDCIDTELECHVAYFQSCSVYVYCDGGASQGSTCELIVTENEDGTTDYSCAAIPTGACCDMHGVSGSCELLGESECTEAGGQWLGAETSCDACPAPELRACCDYETGSCVESATEEECSYWGTWLEPGATCEDCPIPEVIGACCRLNGVCGTCELLGEAECYAAGGYWLGPGTMCGSCPLPYRPHP